MWLGQAEYKLFASLDSLLKAIGLPVRFGSCFNIFDNKKHFLRVKIRELGSKARDVVKRA